MNRTDLENKFKLAKKEKASFIGVLIKMPDYKDEEVIINSSSNFNKKLSYYMETYNENLEHRFSKEIKIIDCAFGDDFTSIAVQLGKQHIW